MADWEMRLGHEILVGDTVEDFKNPEYDKLRPVWHKAVLRSAEPTKIYLPGPREGISWIFDIIPAYDPPGTAKEDWWGKAIAEFQPRTDEEVFLLPLCKWPPDAALTFDAYTPGTDEAAKSRLWKAIGNVLLLSNIQTNPEPAQRLLHPAPPDAEPL